VDAHRQNGAVVPHNIGQKPGGKAAPTFNGKENQMGRNQTERLTLRLTPEEKTALQERMYKAVAPSMRDFVLKMCMDGQIIVNEDLRELNQELRRQGNNLNQLVRLALTAIPTILVLLLWARVGLGI
jgi:uncharacterized protein (DUF1778 family)